MLDRDGDARVRKFATVDASVAEPFLSQAPIPTRRLEGLAETCGLSGATVTEASGVIPLHAIEQFMVNLDARVGDPLFFYKTLEQEVRHDSIANISLPRGVTGIEAIRGVASSISSVLGGADFLCQQSGNKIWILRTAATTEWTDYWPVQQYNLGVALHAVRRVLARHIQPIAIRLSGMVDQRALPDELRDLPIETTRKTMGLAFEISDLLCGSQSLFVDKHRRPHRIEPSRNRIVVEDIAACLASFLRSTAPGGLSRRAAKAFGISERTYRRQLQELGVSHRRLVSDARLEIAKSMLRNPVFSITEIAYELGYTHPSAFTRFFINRVGINPESYRSRIGFCS